MVSSPYAFARRYVKTTSGLDRGEVERNIDCSLDAGLVTSMEWRCVREMVARG